MKRFTSTLGILIGSVCLDVNSLETHEIKRLTQQLPHSAKIIDTKNERNLTSPFFSSLAESSNYIFISNYVNAKFDSYRDADDTLVNIKKSLSNRGFITLSECDGLSCGNALQLARKINSKNFISEKEKQHYSLLYNNYKWYSLHLSSYESNHFMFLRLIEEKLFKASIKHLLFDKESYQLSLDTKEHLTNIVPSIKSSSHTFYIIGHTDDSGTASHNYKLAHQRALSVYKYLISKGVSKNKLAVESAGEHAPLHPNNTQKNKILNRRVELIESLAL